VYKREYPKIYKAVSATLDKMKAGFFRRWQWAILAGVVLVALGIRLIWFQGVGTSDTLMNVQYAYDIHNGDFPTNGNQANSRLGLLIPVSVLYGVFGVSELSSALYPLALSLLGVVLIFLFGKLLFNEKIGLIAAALLAIYPLDVLYATRLMSDVPSAVFGALSVYLFLIGEKSGKGWKSWALYGLSGMSLGISFSIREMAVVTMLFFLGYVAYTRKIRISYGFAAVGFLFILLLEMMFFLAHTGNPLYRFSSIGDYYVESIRASDFYGRLAFPEFFLAFPFVMFGNIQLGYFFMFIALAAIYFAFHRGRGTNLMLMWLVLVFLYFNFGSSSFSAYVPVLAVARYFNYISVPALLLVAAFLADIGKPLKKILVPFAFAFLFGTSMGSLYLDDFRHSLDNVGGLYAEIEDFGDPIYTDVRTIRAINLLSGFDNGLTLIDLETMPENTPKIENSYIIVNRQVINGILEQNKAPGFLPYIDPIPPNWILVRKVGKEPDTILIYYAGKR
jgi:hypothetical protein